MTILAPVNWLGNGTDFFLTNADPKCGGLMDGHGDIAVSFPDDGHPVMCCEAIDLCGDDRDELVVWDYRFLYIYTQDDGERETGYHPVTGEETAFSYRNVSNLFPKFMPHSVYIQSVHI